jgi:hypothetical protein
MKQYTLFIGLTFLMNVSLFGQGFISPDKQWNVRLVGFPASYTTEIFRIEGDSTVNSMLYSKIWISTDSLSSWAFQGLLRENENVVYYIPPGSSEGILYDFNLKTGDTAFVRNIFCGDEEIPVYVLDVDTVEYFGTARKRWHLGENGYTDEFWVEGIGSLNGPLYTKYWHCIVCPVWELLCYHHNDTLQYILPGETECYQNSVGINDHQGTNDILIKPNPVKNGNPIEIEMMNTPVNIDVFNASGALLKSFSPLQGRKISIETNDFDPGLYLLNIKTKENGTRTFKIIIE